MLKETEVKLKLESNKDAQQLIEKIKSLSGSKFDFEEQRDEYFDGGNMELAKNDIVLRLRILNGKPMVALKSPRVVLEDSVRQRIELEFEAADEAAVRERLEKQGLKPNAIIEKRRWEFGWDDCKIAIDELPYIGWFVEIEGKDVGSIGEMIKKLGLEKNEREERNYGEILDGKMAELGLAGRPNLRALFNDKE